jgi:pantetheine-phosphate adenylyltransferase
MNKTAVYAGSFDPFTNGHMDIVERALKMFDTVIILVAISPAKKEFLSKNERMSLLNKIFIENERVKVDSWDGLIVDYVESNNVSAIVRGLRPTGDFEIEFQMASMNRKLNPNAETVFFTTGENLYYISSSLVKEVFNHGGDIKGFVPAVIFKELEKKRS